MPKPSSDFAAAVRQACQLGQIAQKLNGERFGWDDIERITRELDTARTTSPESTPRPKSSNPSPFGDRRAIPPSPEQVTAYALSIGYSIEGQEFCDFYESKGWVVGKAKMKDWCAAVRTWKRGGYGKTSQPTEKIPESYSRF